MRASLFRVGIIGWVLSTAGFAQQASLRVSPPAGAQNVRCELRAVNGAERALANLSEPISCREGLATLSCDSSNAEPIDIPVGEFCRIGKLPMLIGSAVQVSLPRPARTTVEWLELRNGKMTVIAKRDFTPEVSALTVLVAGGRHKLIRFSRFAAMPVTISADQLRGAGTWLLPFAQTGGELVVIAGSATNLPTDIRISGAGAAPVELVEGLAFVRNIRLGSHRIEPVYEGGIRGAVLSVSVTEGTSTVAVIADDELGRLILTGPRDYCGSSTSLTLERPGQRSPLARIVEHRELAKCAWSFGGLPAAEYRAVLAGPTGIAGMATIHVRSAGVASVALSRPPVTLLGRLSFNGRPLPQVELETTPLETDGLPLRVRTDDAGRYRIDFDRPGSHAIRIAGGRGGTRALRSKVFELRVGMNESDWPLTGGTFTLRFTNPDRQKPIQLTLTSNGLPQTVVLPAGQSNLTVENAAFGDYSVSAVQRGAPSGVLQKVQTFSLGPTAPNVALDLSFRTNAATLRLQGPNGSPVAGARVYASLPGGFQITRGPQGPSTGLAEIAPGVFDLSALVPGSPIYIKPAGKLVPVCRLVPAGAEILVRLIGGRTIQLQVEPSGLRQLGGFAGTLLGVENSQCEVPLSLFNWRSLPSVPGGASEFAISNFSHLGEFIWQTQIGSKVTRKPFAVGSNGRATLRLPVPAAPKK